MTVNELIEALEKIKNDGKGDYEVTVQYRDDRGCWLRDDISPDVDETIKRVIF